MSTPEKVLEEAISLKPIEQARLVDCLIAALDKPDPEMDQLWATEAESRLTAYKAGKLKSFTIESVLSKYK